MLMKLTPGIITLSISALINSEKTIATIVNNTKINVNNNFKENIAFLIDWYLSSCFN